MRLIHISDLHIGRRMNDLPLWEEQRDVLDQIAAAVEREQADGLIIAGDIYDKSAPTDEAIALFGSFVARISGLGTKLFMISGNHDNRAMVGYLSDLLRDVRGIYSVDRFEGELRYFSFPQEEGPEVRIYMLPFVKPGDVRRYYPDREIKSTNDAVRAILESTPLDDSLVNILVCHQSVQGAEVCESEEHFIGTSDAIDAALFDGFDYVALGHFHGPQSIRRRQVRYSGTPLKYSLSEKDHTKSLTVFDTSKDIEPREIPLTALRDVREVEGSLEEILDMPYSEDLVRVILTDEMVPPDAQVTVTTVFPNTIDFKVRNSADGYDTDLEQTAAIEDKSVTELFCDLYRLQKGGEEPPEEELELLRDVLAGMESDQ